MVQPTPLSPSGESTPRTQAAAVPLSRFPVGTVAVVDALDMDAPDAALLRAMGLGCSCHLKLCHVGHPCIVAVLTELSLDTPAAANAAGRDETSTDRQSLSGSTGAPRSPAFACCASRIGLSGELAARVMVRPLQ